MRLRRDLLEPATKRAGIGRNGRRIGVEDFRDGTDGRTQVLLLPLRKISLGNQCDNVQERRS